MDSVYVQPRNYEQLPGPSGRKLADYILGIPLKIKLALGKLMVLSNEVEPTVALLYSEEETRSITELRKRN